MLRTYLGKLLSSVAPLLSDPLQILKQQYKSGPDSKRSPEVLPEYASLLNMHSFYPGDYATLDDFWQMYDTLRHLAKSIDTKYALLGRERPNGLINGLPNEVDLEMVLGDLLYLDPPQKDIKNLLIDTPYAQNYGSFDVSNMLVATTNRFGVRLKCHKEPLKNERCIVVKSNLKNGLPVQNVYIKVKCFARISEDILDLGLDLIKNSLSDISSSFMDALRYFETFCGKSSSFSDQTSLIAMLDVCLRVEAGLRARRFESPRLKQQIFWTVYKCLWKKAMPSSKLLTPDDLISKIFKVSSNDNIISGSPIHPYILHRKDEHVSNKAVFVLKDRKEHFKLSVPFDYMALGPFSISPLTWHTKGSPSKIKSMHPAEWNSALLLILPDSFQICSFDVLKRLLLPINTYNAIVDGWERRFLDLYRALPKSTYHAKDVSYFRHDHSTVVATIYNLDFILTKPYQFYCHYSHTYSMPVALLATEPRLASCLPRELRALLSIECNNVLEQASSPSEYSEHYPLDNFEITVFKGSVRFARHKKKTLTVKKIINYL